MTERLQLPADLPEEWRIRVLIPVFKNNNNVQRYSNYRRKKQVSHIMKVWERLAKAMLRRWVTINDQQFAEKEHYSLL